MRNFLWFLIAVTALEFVSCLVPTGVYFDNGDGQTIVDNALTIREKREMELEILNLLDLPRRPRKVLNSTANRSTTKFLLDVYKNLLEKENDDDDDDGNNRRRRSTDLNLSGDEEKVIDESDVIMTFVSNNHFVSGVRHEKGKRLWFDVSKVQVENTIIGAELKIFQNLHFNKETVKKSNKIYTITVYQLARSTNGERELEYISSLNTTAGYSGWLGLNVTDSLTTWVVFPNSNKGLYLSVHPADKPEHEIKPDDIGLVVTKADDEIQPFLVAFFKTPRNMKLRTIEKRSIKKRTDNYVYQDVMKRDTQHVLSNDGKSCKIQYLFISFKALEWQDWIIAPEGYAAHYCYGECKFPLNSHMNATNHAIVQTLMHLTEPTLYPRPCCAPNKLSPISVLYYADPSNVSLKKYKKMVVKSCGCH